MPRNTKSKVKSKRWSEDDILKSLDAIAAGSSIRNAAKEYGMSEGILRKRIKMKEAGKSLIGSGRQPTLEKTVEEQLAKCIGTMCKLGFSPSTGQIKDSVQEYVRYHKLSTPLKKIDLGRTGYACL